VNFGKSLNLFKDKGKTIFPNEISYKEVYTRDGWEQVSEAPDGHTSQFSMHYTTTKWVGLHLHH
jgi:hypothetical protein